METPPQDQPQPTNNSTNPFLWIILVIVILVIAGYGVYAYMTGNTNTNTANTVVTTNQNTNTASNINANIDTSDWQVYTNEKYGFSFRYPSDWTIEEQSGINYDKSIVSITSPETKQTIDEAYKRGGYCEACGPDVSFYYYESVSAITSNRLNNLGATNLDELIERDKGMEKLGMRNINGHEAIAVKEAGFGSYYVLYIQKESGEILRIFVDNWFLHGYQLSPEEEKIISTFLVI